MQNASDGASGNVARDEGHAPSSRDAATTAGHLRNLADWLEAHPDAHVSTVDFIGIPIGSPIRVSCYNCATLGEAVQAAGLIGGEWTRGDGQNMITLRQEILPGVMFQFGMLRSEACPVPDAPEDVPW